MATAEELKAIGNDLYANHDFDAAILVSLSPAQPLIATQFR